MMQKRMRHRQQKYGQTRLPHVRRSYAARARGGQAMIEYVIVAGILLASFAILVVFQDAFDDYGTRVLNLAGYHYP